MMDVNQAIEVLKEFGGGFAAYWTHHLFHKVWRVSSHLKLRGGMRWLQRGRR